MGLTGVSRRRVQDRFVADIKGPRHAAAVASETRTVHRWVGAVGSAVERPVSHLESGRHGVIALQDEALRAVLAVRRFVLALHDRERVHDVVGILTVDPVEVEHQARQARLG